MEEAEHLCDRVCLLVSGKIKAVGTLNEIVAKADLSIRIMAYAKAEELAKLPLDDGSAQHLPLPAGIRVEKRDGCLELSLADVSQISPAMSWLCGKIEISDIDLYKPRLEDVFLKLTGARLEDGEV
jgi:ABC-type multidrug transport system ATPase subunit